MACCGQRRRQAATAFPDAQNADPGVTTLLRVAPATVAYFRYAGPTALTVQGAITGRRYRFPRNGAVVAVDHRDASAMHAVPNLRATASP